MILLMQEQETMSFTARTAMILSKREQEMILSTAERVMTTSKVRTAMIHMYSISETVTISLKNMKATITALRMTELYSARV